MEVLDIVQSAAFKCGLVSSFNPDEFPGDIEDAGRAALINEILPMINCDRTLDVTVTARVYNPTNNMIVLTPLPSDADMIVVGHSPYSTAQALDMVGPENAYGRYLYDHYPSWVRRVPVAGGWFYGRNDDNWPKDHFGNYRNVAIWTTDTQVVYGPTPDNVRTVENVNIDFPPMRVEEVLDEGSRIKYEYVYRSEFERIMRVALPGVYTTEEYEDKIVILINGTGEAKRLILPVPLQVINVRDDYAGDIIAPPKFRRYLIDAVAVSLAIVYGLSTVDAMKAEAGQSYQMLKKNKPQPMHRANVSEEINQTIRHGQQGRRFYAGF